IPTRYASATSAAITAITPITNIGAPLLGTVAAGPAPFRAFGSVPLPTAYVVFSTASAPPSWASASRNRSRRAGVSSGRSTTCPRRRSHDGGCTNRATWRLHQPGHLARTRHRFLLTLHH